MVFRSKKKHKEPKLNITLDGKNKISMSVNG